MKNKEELVEEAQKILYANWRDGFTVPTQKLYPFQWNWDSGFTSIGFSRFNPKYAMEEMRSLFKGQWENGMIPHIIFHSENETTYFPNHSFWETNRNAGSPQKPKTSGITQPPVHGFVLEKIYQNNNGNSEIEGFVKELFSKVVHSHRFFYKYRDPNSEGLVFIYHPWESGRDNSPLWEIAMNDWIVEENEIPSYEREDNKHADATHRPTKVDYDRYVYLLELGKKHAYDGKGIAEESPFLIQDTLINALLIKSNQSLIRLGKTFGFDTKEIEEWQQQSVKQYNAKLWNEELNFYNCFNLRNNELIGVKEIGSMATLFANIPNGFQAHQLHNYLQDLDEKGFLLCPSFDVHHERFDSKRYWRGPIWPQMNWLIYFGLKNYGFENLALKVKENIISLISQQGFYEYFEPEKEISNQLQKGYGGGNFSWTAATVLDLILTE